MYISRTFVALGLLFFLCFIGANLSAQAPRFYTSNPEKVMLDGFDVLSYYTNTRPQKGSPEFQVDYQGVLWRFASKTNLNKFKKNPDVFIPEFGAYCVWALAHGRLVGGSPDIWKIVEGRLYFFSSENVRMKWMKQRELIFRLASENWPEILDQQSLEK